MQYLTATRIMRPRLCRSTPRASMCRRQGSAFAVVIVIAAAFLSGHCGGDKVRSVTAIVHPHEPDLRRTRTPTATVSVASDAPEVLGPLFRRLTNSVPVAQVGDHNGGNGVHLDTVEDFAMDASGRMFVLDSHLNRCPYQKLHRHREAFAVGVVRVGTRGSERPGREVLAIVATTAVACDDTKSGTIERRARCWWR